MRSETPTDKLFVDFVNSEWYDGSGHLDDRLLRAAWRHRFLREWGLFAQERTASAHLRRLLDLRGALRSIVEAAESDRPLPVRPLARLNDALARHAVHYQLDRTRRLRRATAEGAGIAVLEGEIALSAARALAGPEIRRVRSCENRGCRWVFIDTTRNRSRRWCDTARCGNRIRVRRHRARAGDRRSS